MLYMAVTADKYELPLAVAKNAKKLSRMTGYSRTTIDSSISKRRNGKNRGIKFVKVEESEEE